MTPNLVTLTAPGSPAAEAYRALRLNLMAGGRDRPLCTLLVAAAGPAADKASAVANLAVAYAQIGKRIVLVDCDLRRPALHAVFGAGNAEGVTTAIRDEKGPLPLAETGVPGLRLLPSGPATATPSDLLASPAMARLIARLAAEAEVILFDAPPVTVATDAAELATQVDGVLLTISSGVTKREEAQKARDLLTRVGARVLGAVLVGVTANNAVRKYLAA